MLNTTMEATNHVRPSFELGELSLQKILVAIDYSRSSLLALKAAIGIAQNFGSEIFLVNAASPFVYGNVVPMEADTSLTEARAKLMDLVSSEPALGMLRHHEIVAYSGVLELIQRVALESEVDLIVVGSHGASGIDRLVLGSVAESILRKAKCPVLIAGPHTKTEPHPLRSILFATGLKTTGKMAAQYATSLAERAHGRLVFLHVLEQKPAHSHRQQELHEDDLRRQLQQLMPKEPQAKNRLERGRAGEIIPQVAHSEEASLIITGVQDRSTLADHSLWSTLSQVIRKSPCMVLIVRD